MSVRPLPRPASPALGNHLGADSHIHFGTPRPPCILGEKCSLGRGFATAPFFALRTSILPCRIVYTHLTFPTPHPHFCVYPVWFGIGFFNWNAPPKGSRAPFHARQQRGWAVRGTGGLNFSGTVTVILQSSTARRYGRSPHSNAPGPVPGLPTKPEGSSAKKTR